MRFCQSETTLLVGRIVINPSVISTGERSKGAIVQKAIVPLVSVMSIHPLTRHAHLHRPNLVSLSKYQKKRCINRAEYKGDECLGNTGGPRNRYREELGVHEAVGKWEKLVLVLALEYAPTVKSETARALAIATGRELLATCLVGETERLS